MLSSVAALVLAVVVGVVSIGEDTTDPSVRPTEVLVPVESPADAVVALDAALFSASLPGRGSVVDRLDVGGVDTIVTASSGGMSAVWQEGGERWQLTDRFEDFQVLDAIVFADRLFVTGRSPLSHDSGTTFAGDPRDLQPVGLPLAQREYAYRLEVAGGAVFVFTRSPRPSDTPRGAGSVADAADHSVMWSTDGESFSRLALDRRSDVGVFDVLATDEGLRFYGHAGGRPASWLLERSSGRWVLGPEIAAAEGHRVVSVVEARGANRLGLVVDAGDSLAPSTELWSLGGDRWEPIGDVGRGVYRELLTVTGAGMVAIAEHGAPPIWSADGREWETIPLATRGGHGVVESAIHTRERGLEVLGMSMRWHRPTIWSSPQPALTFEMPASVWTRIGPAEDGRYVLHVGDSVQLLWEDGLVWSRTDWRSEPTLTDLADVVSVYAVPDAVDVGWGTVAIVSSGGDNDLVAGGDGSGWRVIDDPPDTAIESFVSLAAHEDRVMALARSGDGLAGVLVTEDVVTGVEVPTSEPGDAFGWVDRLGFTIVQSRETSTRIHSTRDGSGWQWSLLSERMDSPVIVDGRLVGRADGEWIEYRAGASEPYPFELPGPSGDGALWSDGRQATYSEDGTRWLTEDFETWVRLELGFGGPSFGSLGRSWLDDDVIVVESYLQDGPELFSRPRR